MDKEKFSLYLMVGCLVGVIWVDKQHLIGHISTVLFLIASLLSLIAYFKATKE